MGISNAFMLKLIHVLVWIIFIGLCIKTGSLLVSFVVNIAINAAATENLYLGLNFSDLYDYSLISYDAIISMLILITGLKAYIAYLVIKIFMELKMEKPFSVQISLLISRISRISFLATIMSILAESFCESLVKNGIEIPLQWACEEMIFFSGLIYIISLIFSKGIELQTENELTV
jgi:hypothetical protein